MPEIFYHPRSLADKLTSGCEDQGMRLLLLRGLLTEASQDWQEESQSLATACRGNCKSVSSLHKQWQDLALHCCGLLNVHLDHDWQGCLWQGHSLEPA